MGAPAPRCVKCWPRISRERVQRRRWSARLRLHVFCARATGRPHVKSNLHSDGDSRSGIMLSCNNHNDNNLNAASHCMRHIRTACVLPGCACCAVPRRASSSLCMPLVAIHPYMGLWRDHSCSETSTLCAYGGIQPDEAQQLVTANTPAADKLNSLWP
jgi:hypothetical protein